MRWMAILLLLAACGRSWLRDEGGGRVAEALRSPEKSAPVLVAGDRAWMIRRGALREEIDTFANELVEAAAREESWSPGSRLGDGDVVALAYPGRRLEFGTPHGFVVVQRSTGERGTRYWATVWKSERRKLFVTAKGAALDRAWTRLEKAASKRGGRPWGPSQGGVAGPEADASEFVGLAIREIGIDFRGVGKEDG